MRKGWLIYSLCLLVFTAYLVLNTFVLSSAYQQNATEQNTAMFETLSADAQGEEPADGGTKTLEGQESADTPFFKAHGGKRKRKNSTSSDAASTQEASSAETGEMRSYQDDNVSITLTTRRFNDTTLYVADVTLRSAEYLKTAFAQDTYGKNVTETTSETAAAHNAILAVNGDYYGVQERGYVIRNGVVYRDSAASADVLCIYADGHFEIVDPDTVTAQELVEQGVWQAFSFGPALVENGAVSVSEGEEVGKAMASNPRTAIGIIDDLHYVFVVSDGRTSESEGLSLHELAEFLQQLGVQSAYNLDGGGSSTMVFQGGLINRPTSNGHSIQERGVSDIVYIG